LEIYRDKLLPDDKAVKQFYGQALRELPIDVEIPDLKISNSSVIYEELVDNNLPAGKIWFNELDGKIVGLTNHSKDSAPTSIAITSKFMNDAHVNLRWSFNVSDSKDVFKSSGSIKGFHSINANSFLRPNLNVEAEGDIDQLYFTVEGNATNSRGDMKMKYHDFKFKVLKKDGLGVNKLLTAIGSIFINDGSKADSEGFRHGEINVERDRTKSFFNYLWANIKDGILSTITGDGKKKK